VESLRDASNDGQPIKVEVTNHPARPPRPNTTLRPNAGMDRETGRDERILRGGRYALEDESDAL
jgi:hypothetical protein